MLWFGGVVECCVLSHSWVEWVGVGTHTQGRLVVSHSRGGGVLPSGWCRGG